MSSKDQTRVEIENLIDGIDLSETLTRAKLEQLCRSLFEKTLKPIDKILKEASVSIENIDEVLLVGGSTRIPLVRKLVRDYFDNPEINLNTDMNPDEAIARGAAIYAAMLSDKYGSRINPNDKIVLPEVLVDTLPFSLGTDMDV